METKIIEASSVDQHGQGCNWGKFMLGRLDHEWGATSGVDSSMLLRGRGWTPKHLWVVDLQTGEGAFFMPGGLAKADLDKRRIWVCPLFEPFLNWVYQQDLTDLSALPDTVEFSTKDAPFDLRGYRRPGR